MPSMLAPIASNTISLCEMFFKISCMNLFSKDTKTTAQNGYKYFFRVIYLKYKKNGFDLQKITDKMRL